MRARRRLIHAALLALALCGIGVGVAGAAAWTSSGASSSSTFSAAAAFPPIVSAVPDVLGVAQVAISFTATTGTFNPTPTSTAVLWLRCDAAGASCTSTGSTGTTYTVAIADIGSTIRAQVTPTNNGAVGAAVLSEPSQAVLAINLGPILNGLPGAVSPTITGTTAVGSTLTGAKGTWLGVNTYTYQWLRCDATGAGCTAIAGATALTYAQVAADQGKRLVFAVTASALGLLPNTVRSRVTAVVA